MSHKEVVLGNLSVRRWLVVPWASESGSCRATETADGERDNTTNSNFAPEERPDSRIVRDRSSDLF